MRAFYGLMLLMLWNVCNTINVGDSVQLTGLHNRPELNGRAGIVSGYNNKTERYQVTILNSNVSRFTEDVQIGTVEAMEVLNAMIFQGGIWAEYAPFLLRETNLMMIREGESDTGMLARFHERPRFQWYCAVIQGLSFQLRVLNADQSEFKAQLQFQLKVIGAHLYREYGRNVLEYIMQGHRGDALSSTW
eukprot:153285_1